MGALSVTSNSAYREPFQPLIPGVTFVSPDDPAALEAAVTEQTAAIIAEPIQGEGGVRPLSQRVRGGHRTCVRPDRARSSSPTKCSADWAAPANRSTSPVLGLTPDLISIGKALGSGVPIGAALVAERVAAQVFAGDHGSTYGGNLLSTRAGLYVLEQLTGTTEAAPYHAAGRADRARA